jgi:hypothetical protein
MPSRLTIAPLMIQRLFTNFREVARKHPLLVQVVALFALNLFFTFIAIRSIPAGQTYDEIIYQAEARAIAKYGTDLTGTWRPWHLAPSDGWYSELTSTTWVPAAVLFPNDPLLASRFVSGLLGSALPIILGLLAVRIFREKRFFLLTALVLTVNPWIFQFSRMSFDSLPSVVLYPLGMLILLSARAWWKLLSVPLFFWGFFQYQGHKPLLVPLVILAVAFLIIEGLAESPLTARARSVSKSIFVRLQKNFVQLLQLCKNNLPALAVTLFAVVLTISYVLRMPTLSSGVRSENFSIFDSEEIASTVNEQRRLSFVSPLAPLFTNRFIEQSKVMMNGFIASFDPTVLFMRGNEATDLYAVIEYGFLHWADALLLVIFCALVVGSPRYRLGSLFVLGFIVIGSISNVLRSGDIWITFRGAFVIIGLSWAAGIALSRLALMRWKWLAWAVAVVYFVSVLPFLYLYFFRYPVQQTKYEGFYYRVMANYLERTQEQPFVLVPDRADAMLDYLAVYNNLLEDETQEAVYLAKNSRPDKQLSRGMILGGCPEVWKSIDSDTLIALDYRRLPCDVSSTYFTQAPSGESVDQQAKIASVELLSVVDSGTRFRIVNDRLCSEYDLPDFTHVQSNIFAVESLSDEEFCRSFFVSR